VPLFVNPKAGTGPTGIDALREKFGALATPEEVEPSRLAARIERAVRDGAEVVAVAGGDGSLHTAVNALAGSETALAVVPAGTLNNFAHRLGIEDIDAAVAILRDGEPQWLPMGYVGDELFLNTLTFGEYARTVRIREKLRPYLTKWPAAFFGFLEIVISLRTFDVELESEGRRVACNTPFIWAGVGLGSFPRVDESFERRSSPDLEIAVLHARTPWAMAGFMWRASMQMLREQYPVRDRALEVFQTRELTLHTKKRLDGTADGELLRMPAPVNIGVRDRGVKVLMAARAATEPGPPRTPRTG
jgi:undecaprenyl-diphosphatase